jgi:hypothetical protein
LLGGGSQNASGGNANASATGGDHNGASSGSTTQKSDKKFGSGGGVSVSVGNGNAIGGKAIGGDATNIGSGGGTQNATGGNANASATGGNHNGASGQNAVSALNGNAIGGVAIGGDALNKSYGYSTHPGMPQHPSKPPKGKEYSQIGSLGTMSEPDLRRALGNLDNYDLQHMRNTCNDILARPTQFDSATVNVCEVVASL